MTIAEKLEYTHRRLLTAADAEQEMSVLGEFLKHLAGREIFPEVVRYFTTRLDDVISKMRLVTTQIKPPGQFARLENPQAWSALAWALIERRLPQIGRDLFAAMYEFQLAQQTEQRRRLYKGVSLQNLSWANYLLGEQTAARKAAQLALIEEVLNTLDMGDVAQLRVVSANPAHLMLRQTFKIPTGELEAFIRFCRDYAQTHPERCAYPEDCYISYLRAMAEQPVQLAFDHMPRVSHFNYAYFTTLIDKVGRSVTARVVETLLADLVCYLFVTVDEFQLCEQDCSLPADSFNLIVRNSILDDPVMAELGTYLAVEWRYWARGLAATELLTIAGKLRIAGLRTAILFARDGDPGGTASEPVHLQTVAQQIYQQDRLNIIILTLTDLLGIEQRQINLPALLKVRAEALRFNRRIATGAAISPAAAAETRQRADEKATPALPADAPNPESAVAPTDTVGPATTATTRPPRLVIRSSSSTSKVSKPVESQPPTIYKPVENQPSLSYKAVVNKPMETPLLKPCTSCKNPTSLTCQSCSRAFCNVHLHMPELRCEACLKAPAADAPSKEV